MKCEYCEIKEKVDKMSFENKAYEISVAIHKLKKEAITSQS